MTLRLTVLTPTWNRLHLLPRLYQSLEEQEANKDTFEWLVVDDGSTDGTEEWLANLVDTATFRTRVIRQENGGKFRALNLGAHHANAPWQLILDSDDLLFPEALKTVIDVLNINSNTDIGMLAALYEVSEKPSPMFQVPKNPCRYGEWVDHQKQFDFLPVLRSDLARSVLYPSCGEEKYFPESWRYYKISETNDCFFINRRIAKAEYQQGGLSSISLDLRIQSPNNTRYANYIAFTHLKGRWLRICKIINFVRFSVHAGRIVDAVKRTPLPYIACVPVGLIYSVIDKLRSRAR